MTQAAIKQDDEMTLEEKQQEAAAWFRKLRDDICASYEELEDELEGGPHANEKAGRFERKAWDRPEGGGGEISLMRGRVFEKVGVNISTVHGEFDEKFRNEIPGAKEDPRFWASGISLVAHQQSPLVPAAHFNTRMITTGQGTRLWFGGGGDLNPMFEVEEDTHNFHEAFKHVCDDFDPSFYPAFKGWCDEYFFIKHRGFARGVGGIFYDYLGLNSLGENTETIEPAQFGRGGLGQEQTEAGMKVATNADLDWSQAFAFTKAVGEAFRSIYPEIIRQHFNHGWTDEQRQHQLERRGYYAEYNLLYDRGTRFGLMTGGNTEAILMSLPPEAKWP